MCVFSNSVSECRPQELFESRLLISLLIILSWHPEEGGAQHLFVFSSLMFALTPGTGQPALGTKGDTAAEPLKSYRCSKLQDYILDLLWLTKQSSLYYYL